MIASATDLTLAVVGGGFVLVALGTIVHRRRRKPAPRTDDAGRARLLRELARYE